MKGKQADFASLTNYRGRPICPRLSVHCYPTSFVSNYTWASQVSVSHSETPASSLSQSYLSSGQYSTWARSLSIFGKMSSLAPIITSILSVDDWNQSKKALFSSWICIYCYIGWKYGTDYGSIPASTYISPCQTQSSQGLNTH